MTLVTVSWVITGLSHDCHMTVFCITGCHPDYYAGEQELFK